MQKYSIKTIFMSIYVSTSFSEVLCYKNMTFLIFELIREQNWTCTVVKLSACVLSSYTMNPHTTTVPTPPLRHWAAEAVP